MKAMLLRVGIDSGSGGCLAPIFTSGSFEFICIPEDAATSEARTYEQLLGRTGRPLADFVPMKLRSRVPHLDPEFETCSYGDPGRIKRAQLARLERGDLLVFYAGLRAWDVAPDLAESRLFIVGYFTVERTLEFHDGICDEITRASDCANNAHMKRRTPDANLSIIKGDPTRSRLFDRAVPIGSLQHDVLPALRPLIGYAGSLLRAVGHVVDGVSAANLRAWMETGPQWLVAPAALENTLGRQRLFSYVIVFDTGFAPNPTSTYCSIACCKPRIRKSALVGDWVMGVGDSDFGPDRLVWLMRVDECLTFAQFYADPRFAEKRPSGAAASDPNGDNIYYRNGDHFEQLPNRHHGEDQITHDTAVDRVLLGSVFWYFGKDAPRVPAGLATATVIGAPTYQSRRGHRVVDDVDAIRALVAWVSSSFRIGRHGTPRHAPKRSQLMTAAMGGCGPRERRKRRAC